tara:strand:+ start:105 stop:353 length:249 start_codon:yes stop_codon:yes gene_type:complete
MKIISKSKLTEIRRSLYDDDGYTRINNPHFDLIFEEAFKAGMNRVNNGVLDDVSCCECSDNFSTPEVELNKCFSCGKKLHCN